VLFRSISSVQFDQSRTEYAKQYLEKVIICYPESKYAFDALLKMNLVNDHLAGKEMFVGRYYLKKRSYIAAVKRFQQVVEKYETTTHIIEALYRLRINIV
jgi:outer membrane protein assembly factor BamD